MNRPDPSLLFKFRQQKDKDMVVGCYRWMYLRDGRTLKPPLVPYFPSLRSTSNEFAAASHRFGCDMPPVLDGKEFHKYAVAVIRKHFKPITSVPSFTDWLEQTPYSGKRKQYFRDLRSKIGNVNGKTIRVGAFIKAEGYEEPKNARAILSYSDESKVILGPICHAIDKATFKSVPYFVKGTDPKCWPQMLKDRFADRPVLNTDFSSFEAHHRGLYSDIILFWFRHMLSQTNGHRNYLRLIKRLVTGRNHIRFPTSECEIDQRLMSGALWTSSANGMLNLLVMSYLSLRGVHNLDGVALAEHFLEFNGLVEGDDGICADSPVRLHDITRLGLKLDMQRYSSFTEAGFCSIYCDGESLATVRDPRKLLRTFFLLPKELYNARDNKVRAYLRAKALSYKYLAGNAPVVGPLMDRVLEVTAGVDHRNAFNYLDLHQRAVLAAAAKAKVWLSQCVVAASARRIVEENFGVSISAQFELEAILSKMTGPTDCELWQFANRTDTQHSNEFVRFSEEHEATRPRQFKPEHLTGRCQMRKQLRQQRYTGFLEKPPCMSASEAYEPCGDCSMME
nr:RNA-dependent RNA polymerase [Tolivirales sp.]